MFPNNKQEVCMESATVSSDRLRKAIERNRRKQSSRSASPGKRATNSSPKIWSARSSTPPLPSSTPRQASTRRTVGTPDDVEFTTSLRRPRAKAPANVGYGTSRSLVKTSPTRKKTTKRKKNVKGHALMLKVGWLFAGVLILRLILSDGGILDFYNQSEFVQDKRDELANLKVENTSLVKEIGLIKNSVRYQRKLVRDHLGFIDKDEFLILFQKGSPSQAI